MNTGARTMRLAQILAAAVLGVAALPVQADEGPMVLGRRQAPPILTLDPFHGNIGVTGVGAYQTTSNGGSTSQATSALITPTLTIGTGGAIVSKNLIDWRAVVSAGITESWESSTTSSQSSMGLFNAYQFDATLLRTTLLPTSLFAHRSESYVTRAFAALVRNTTTDYGASASLRGPVPTSLRYTHTNTVQEDLAHNLQFALDEDRVQLESEWEPNDQHHLTLDYEGSTINQHNPDLVDNTSAMQNGTVTHYWNIDRDARYTLAQSVNYSDQTGAFPFSQLRLTEILRLRHTQNFETNWSYNYDSQTYGSSQTNSQSVNAGFMHRLFSSVTTTGQAGYAQTAHSNSGAGEVGSSSESSNYFGNLSVNYIKKVPLGQWSANAGCGFSQSENGAVGSVQSFNEPQTFSDPQPIILTRAQINPTSIAVFDAGGVRRFVEGIDYTVEKVGNTVRINRILGGNIVEDTVRLNYQVDPLPGYTSSTNTINAGTRYDFTEGLLTGLGVYTRYSQQNQTISSNQLQGDNVKELLFGADYRVWKLTLNAEQEYRMSTLAPSDSTRFSATYADRLGDRATLALNAVQNFTNYPNTGDHMAVSALGSNLEYRITANLRSTLSARWRYEDSSRLGQRMGFEETADLRWRVRQTDFYFQFRHTTLLSSPDSDSSSLFFQFGITRGF